MHKGCIKKEEPCFLCTCQEWVFEISNLKTELQAIIVQSTYNLEIII